MDYKTYNSMVRGNDLDGHGYMEKNLYIISLRIPGIAEIIWGISTKV